jgi:hypothetical protein
LHEFPDGFRVQAAGLSERAGLDAEQAGEQHDRGPGRIESGVDAVKILLGLQVPCEQVRRAAQVLNLWVPKPTPSGNIHESRLQRGHAAGPGNGPGR